MIEFPVVEVNDNGIRPAGPPDECFYCHQKVGQQHGSHCVTVHKTVRVKYTFDIEISIPHSWTKENIEFHRNDSSWCADNAIDDIEAFMVKREAEGNCLCPHFECQYIEDVDTTPRRSK